MELITIDTNILSKALAGNEKALNVFQGNLTYISFIVQIEMLSASHYSKKQVQIIEQSFSEFLIHPYSQSLQEKVIEIRRTYKLKIPDAFIAATALELKLPLFSNDAIFTKVKPLNFIYIEF
jgi:predicted nucleic acid-binding protein